MLNLLFICEYKFMVILKIYCLQILEMFLLIDRTFELNMLSTINE